MKFVYFGYDFMIPAVKALREQGHELLAIYSFPCDGIFSANAQAQQMAFSLGVPFTTEKPTGKDIKSCIRKGAQMFFSGGYLYKIPPIEEAYGINVHPTFLPKGRGMMPVPYVLTEHPDAAGVSIHKLTQGFDEGDILWQKKIALAPDEDVETYSAKALIETLQILPDVFKNIESYWSNAAAQKHGESSYFPPLTEAMRTLDWGKKAAEIQKLSNAFGRFGCHAILNKQPIISYNLKAWMQDHHYKPGTVVGQNGREVLMACADGFVSIKEWEIPQL